MDFSEKDLEDIIFEAMKTRKGIKNLRLRGLPVNGYPARQVKLGNYGRIDILTVSLFKKLGHKPYTLEFTVYELKKDEIDMDTIIQGCRYVEGLKHLFENTDERIEVVFSLRLIGRKIDMNDYVFVYNNLPENFEIYTYKYSMDGISFELHDKTFVRSEPSFSDKIKNIASAPGVAMIRSLLNFTDQEYE